MPLDPERLPRHIAVIMDGNGRWARARGLPRAAGHKAGVDAVRRVVRAASELGLGALTLYAFSTENWGRPSAEVGALMRLLSWALGREALELERNNVRLGAIGRLSDLPAAARKDLAAAVERLGKNTGLRLTLALNYGARQEIVDAVNAGLADGVRRFDEQSLAQRLYTADLPELDLVVRTSGEMRLSNFLLWQAAYAEFVATPVLWPDFDREHLIAAIREFQKRDRRFGGLSTKA